MGLTSFVGLSRPNMLKLEKPASYAVLSVSSIFAQASLARFPETKKPTHCVGFFQLSVLEMGLEPIRP